MNGKCRISQKMYTVICMLYVKLQVPSIMLLYYRNWFTLVHCLLQCTLKLTNLINILMHYDFILSVHVSNVLQFGLTW